MFPILEFDPTPRAIIEPASVLSPIDIPEHCVLCFFEDVFKALNGQGRLKVAAMQRSEIGDNPLYEMDMDGRRIALMHPGVGASISAAFLEEAIARGCRKFIACGGAGVLNRDMAVGHVVVPHSAVRDEGTSYHYLPPGREVSASPAAVVALESTLQANDVPYVLGKTWTTDAIYRETPDKVKRRKEEGCLVVEMEAAAFFAVAQFRGVTFGQLLYGGDNLDSDQWDSRHWDKQATVREKLFWLAVEACLKL
jgi:uridine phosphorylase